MQATTQIVPGKQKKSFSKFFEDLKPEAAYFFPEGGERAGLFGVDIPGIISLVSFLLFLRNTAVPEFQWPRAAMPTLVALLTGHRGGEIF